MPCRVEPGHRALFVPYAEGIYAPLNIHQYSQDEVASLLRREKVPFSKEQFSEVEDLIRNEFVLDVDSLDQKTRELVMYLTCLDRS